MKRLELTPQLIAMIKGAVGADVEVSDGFAVFEAITLNSKPLIGKNGTIWEGAVASPLTLQQIGDRINNGGHVPLISNHVFGDDQPHGRIFHGAVNYDEEGDVELRTLFYLDPTEEKLATKIDAGSLDEVSISFLPTQYLCSECEFDYLGEEATSENLYSRTCSNGHEIGSDGVHLRMVGLSQLIEVSLVARGAADGPKIIGRSGSKLAPASAQRLAARGFEIDGLVVQASRGENIVTIDTNKLTADLIAAGTKVGVLEAAATAHAAALEASAAKVTAAETRVSELTAELNTANQALVDANKSNKTDEADAAIVYLSSVLTKLHTATGTEVPAELPKTVAELTAAIDAKTAGLTAILPVGGVTTAAPATDDAKPSAVALSAFKVSTR